MSGEEDYVPSSNTDEDNTDSEGFDEGIDSVLLETKDIDENAMDTIARSVSHNYYLRSLHQPERDLPPTPLG